jgi:hypothetical protein
MSNLEWHKRYDNVDGTGDMLFGFMLLGFGLVGPVQTLLPDAAWRHGLLGAILPMYGVLIPMMGLGYAVRHLIKRHVTWPRTGYVAGFSPWRRAPGEESAADQAPAGVPTRKALWVAMGILGLVSALIGAAAVCAAALARQHHAAEVARLGFAAFWTLLFTVWAARMETNPWRWFFVALAGAGLLAMALLLPGGFTEFMQRAMLFVGLVWLTSGGVTLIWYIRHTGRPAGETQ